MSLRLVFVIREEMGFDFLKGAEARIARRWDAGKIRVHVIEGGLTVYLLERRNLRRSQCRNASTVVRAWTALVHPRDSTIVSRHKVASFKFVKLFHYSVQSFVKSYKFLGKTRHFSFILDAITIEEFFLHCDMKSSSMAG